MFVTRYNEVSSSSRAVAAAAAEAAAAVVNEVILAAGKLGGEACVQCFRRWQPLY
jgi:hypothetical protein